MMRRIEPRRAGPLGLGLLGGVFIAVLGGGDIAIQTQRQLLGAAAHWIAIVFLLSSLVVLALIAYRVAHAVGRARAGIWNSAVAAVLGVALLLAEGLAIQRLGGRVMFKPEPVGIYILVVLIFVLAGGLAGALVGLPGALVGRARWRAQHPDEAAIQAAARAATRAAAARRRRRQRTTLREMLYGLLLAGAMLLSILVPIGLEPYLYASAAHGLGLAEAAAALLAGGAMLVFARRTGRVGYLLDLLGLLALAVGIQLAIHEFTGQSLGLVSAVTTLVWCWLAARRFMGEGSVRRPDPPEPAPVLFRHDGETIVFYRRWRTLGSHAAFAGAVFVVFGALAVLVRGAGPVPVIALGAFAAMGLFGCSFDLVRLLWRWPSLEITSDGIIDRASGFVTGFGLIPWHEIGGVFGAPGALRGNAFPELMIIPHSFKRMLARQHPLKRLLLRLFAFNGGGLIPISSLLLPSPPREVARQIDAYVRTHAPPDYLEEEDEATDVEDAGDTEPATPTT